MWGNPPEIQIWGGDSGEGFKAMRWAEQATERSEHLFERWAWNVSKSRQSSLWPKLTAAAGAWALRWNWQNSQKDHHGQNGFLQKSPFWSRWEKVKYSQQISLPFQKIKWKGQILLSSSEFFLDVVKQDWAAKLTEVWLWLNAGPCF